MGDVKVGDMCLALEWMLLLRSVFLFYDFECFYTVMQWFLYVTFLMVYFKKSNPKITTASICLTGKSKTSLPRWNFSTWGRMRSFEVQTLFTSFYIQLFSQKDGKRRLSFVHRSRSVLNHKVDELERHLV